MIVMPSMQDYQDRIAPSRIEKLFGLFALLTYEGAFFVLLRPTLSEGAELRASDPLARIANVTVLCGVLFFAARRKRILDYLRRHAWLHALIIVYCLASALWSLYPLTSLRRGLSLATAFGFGFYAVITYGPRGYIRLYGWSLFVGAVASFVALPIFHGRVYDNADIVTGTAIRTFHGIYAQKNELSVEMLMGICCWSYLGILAPKRAEIERRLWPFALLVMFAAMVYAKGTTSILATMLIAVAVTRMRLPGWRTGLVLYSGLAFAVLVFVSILVVDPQILFALLGKDASMTGRIPLWIESARAAAARLWLGYGYGAFWNPDSVLTQYVWARAGWPAPNAHNGLLELDLDMGLLGGALYLWMMARFGVRALGGLRDPGFPEAKFLALFVIALLVETLDEGTIGWPDAIAITVAYASAVTSIRRAGTWPLPFVERGPRRRPALDRFGVRPVRRGARSEDADLPT